MRTDRWKPCHRLATPIAATGFALLVSACASTATLPGRIQHDHAALLYPSSGTNVPVGVVEPPRAILATIPAMQALLQRHVKSDARPGTRLRQLLDTMQDEGLLQLSYQHGATSTAADTFSNRSGNCLSFTNLFIALARAAGLDVRYQLVDIPVHWQRDGRWIVMDDHINAVLQNVRLRGSYRHDFVVDFNMADFKSHYPRKIISDQTAFALYYSNRAVEHMRRGHDRVALAHFRQAHQLHPRLPALWLNLATFHRLRGDRLRAQSALLTLLKDKPNNLAALSSLELLYREDGKLAWAEEVAGRVQRLRNRNPYYFYQRSLAAYASGNLEQARILIDRAIGLEEQDHQFFFLRSNLARSEGDTEQARQDLRRARALSQDSKLRKRYTQKLLRLQALANG